jgi:hypothetical protein
VGNTAHIGERIGAVPEWSECCDCDDVLIDSADSAGQLEDLSKNGLGLGARRKVV